MVAVDTNVVVRLLTADNAAQYKASVALFSTETIFIPLTVLLETEWVLRVAYERTAAEVCEALRRVLGLPNVVVADGQRVAQAIAWHERGIDFADALHLALSQGHKTLKTFDTAFVRQAKGLGECQVEKP